MIIVDLKSAGLGNSMFQYAVGRALSLKMNTTLKFDITSLCRNQMPFFPLTYDEKINYLKDSILAFKIDFQIASEKEIKKIRSDFDERMIKYKYIRKISKLLIPKKIFYYKEKIIHHFYPNLMEKNNEDIYLDGTFINPRYINSIKNVLLKDFTLKNDLTISQEMIFKKIISSESVSIHIRRGDYKDKSQTKNLYPTYGVSYIKKAINLIESQKSGLSYFVFSDDIDWCKKELNIIRNMLFVSENKPFEDFWLMKSCKNNIIANSTFSWWAAWLNTNQDKIVVAPRKWRNDCIDTTDLLIDGWKIVD